jgi:hypothetical protein
MRSASTQRGTPPNEDLRGPHWSAVNGSRCAKHSRIDEAPAETSREITNCTTRATEIRTSNQRDTEVAITASLRLLSDHPSVERASPCAGWVACAVTDLERGCRRFDDEHAMVSRSTAVSA